LETLDSPRRTDEHFLQLTWLDDLVEARGAVDER
jgi:hypothetical protein